MSDFNPETEASLKQFWIRQKEIDARTAADEPPDGPSIEELVALEQEVSRQIEAVGGEAAFSALMEAEVIFIAEEIRLEGEQNE